VVEHAQAVTIMLPASWPGNKASISMFRTGDGEITIIWSRIIYHNIWYHYNNALWFVSRKPQAVLLN